MELEGALPHSEGPTTCTYSEPDQSSPCPFPLLKIRFILSSPLFLRLPSGLFPLGAPTKTLYAPLHYTCYVPHPPLYSWFGHSNNILWEVQIIMLLIM
jgi:hypothetical protein